MRTALRKMGNSAGMIVPKAILAELGSEIGEEFEIRTEDGKIVASPVRAGVRPGWAEAAALIGAEADAEAEDWLDLASDADAAWKW